MATKISFQLDAGKILAKLHRGACQTYPDMRFFNTGMIKDRNIGPEQVDGDKNINFDIVESGNYEVGVVITNEAVVKVNASIQDILKALEKDAKKNGEDDKKEQGKAQDGKEQQNEKPGEKNAEQQTGSQQDKQQTSSQQDKQQPGGQQDKQQPPINQPPDKQQSVNEDVTKNDPKHTVSSEDLLGIIVKSSMGEATPDELAEIAKNAPEHVIKALKNNQDGVKLFMEHTIPLATVYLQEYMKVFAGEEEANKITEKDVQVTYIPKKFADPFKIDGYKKMKYQIPAETDEQVRAMKIDQLENNPNAKSFKLNNVCFKIGYSLTGAK